MVDSTRDEKGPSFSSWYRRRFRRDYITGIRGFNIAVTVIGGNEACVSASFVLCVINDGAPGTPWSNPSTVGSVCGWKMEYLVWKGMIDSLITT
jgi:hypothetical protein